MAESRVSLQTVERAVNSLLKWRSSQSEHQNPQLLDQDEFVYLIVTLKKIPSGDRTNSHKIPLPNPLYDAASAELCLLVDDRPSSGLTKDAAAKKIAADSVPISKVIKLSKLKSDYKPFEAKRKLCDSFDMFFADKRAVPLLPKLLGKEFFRKRKIPVPVDLRRGNWREQVERGCSSAQLFLRTGTCSVVRVARASMAAGDVAANVAAAIEGVASVVPRKWTNVRSFHVKLLESVALPVYQALPESRLRIEGVVVPSEEPAPAAVVAAEKMVKVKKIKGRIHEVRYMDESNELDGLVENQDSGEVKRKKAESGAKKVKKSKKIRLV